MFFACYSFKISYEQNFLIIAVVTTLIWIVFLLLFEATLLSTVGTTLGKFLFGMEVRRIDGKILTFSEAFSRTYNMLSRGLYFLLFFPIITGLAFYNANKALTQNGKTSWDDDNACVVRCKKINALRFYICVAVAVIFTCGYTGARIYAKQELKNTLRAEATYPSR